LRPIFMHHAKVYIYRKCYQAMIKWTRYYISSARARHDFIRGDVFHRTRLIESGVLSWYKWVHRTKLDCERCQRTKYDADSFRRKRQQLTCLVSLCNVAVFNRKLALSVELAVQFRVRWQTLRALTKLVSRLLKSRFLARTGRMRGDIGNACVASVVTPIKTAGNKGGDSVADSIPGHVDVASIHSTDNDNSSIFDLEPLPAIPMASPEDIDTDPSKRPKMHHYDDDDCGVSDMLLEAQLALMESYLHVGGRYPGVSSDGDIIGAEIGNAATPAGIPIPPLPLFALRSPMLSSPSRVNKRKLKGFSSQAVDGSKYHSSSASIDDDDHNNRDVVGGIESYKEPAPASVVRSAVDNQVQASPVPCQLEEKFIQKQNETNAGLFCNRRRQLRALRRWIRVRLQRRAVAIEYFVQCYTGVRESRFSAVAAAVCCPGAGAVSKLDIPSADISPSASTASVHRRTVAMLDGVFFTRCAQKALQQLKKGVDLAASKRVTFMILRRHHRKFVRRTYVRFLTRWVYFRVRCLLRRDREVRSPNCDQSIKPPEEQTLEKDVTVTSA
jgi:hypothetical protein